MIIDRFLLDIGAWLFPHEMYDGEPPEIYGMQNFQFEDRASFERVWNKIVKILEQEAQRQGKTWKPPMPLSAFAALWEKEIANRAAHPRVSYSPPTCPICGKDTTSGQLGRRGFCMRCEKEKRAPMQAWVALWEQVFSLPIPIWRSYAEIKQEVR